MPSRFAPNSPGLGAAADFRPTGGTGRASVATNARSTIGAEEFFMAHWNPTGGNPGNPYHQGNWGGWPNPAFRSFWNPWTQVNTLNNVGQWYPFPSTWGRPARGINPTSPWYGGSSTFGYNPPGFGYGSAYGYGPGAAHGPAFNYAGGYGFGEGWGNVGQGFADDPEGPYAGVGPRNYRRSDHRIEEDVCDELTIDSNLNAHGIEVKVTDGVVTLGGSVPTSEMKRRAEEDAESILGVVDVCNNLGVARPGPAEPAGHS